MGKIIFSEKIKGLKHICSACRDGSKMIATGYLYKDDNSSFYTIEFKCEKDEEIVDMWDKEYEPLIQEVLKEQGIK